MGKQPHIYPKRSQAPWKRLELDPYGLEEANVSSKERFHNSSRSFAVAFSSR